MRACNITRRFWKVWYRNLVVNRQNWKVSFLPPLLEPLFYLLAFGVGLSSLVGRFDYGGSQVTYVQFIAPALLAINIMNNAFFENTYSSYVRMYYQKTFDAILATPLTLKRSSPEKFSGERRNPFWPPSSCFPASASSAWSAILPPC
jgi:lipooligosaccharide transport system permease protein